MKKFLLLIAAIGVLLSGCTKIEESIDALGARLDKLEQTIPTIDEQISSIQNSIEALKTIDNQLDESIKALEASDKATAEEIAALKDADKAIEAKIAELKKYVDDALKATKDWVSATFATLEQLNTLSNEIVVLKNLVDANKIEAAANLATAISNLESSLKSWVGAQLSNYYTIAEVEAKITALQTAITEGDNALQEELNKLKTQLETTKSEITEAYKKAISDAINTNNGVINNKIASEIATVNQRIDSEVAAINAKIAELQAQVNQNTADIANLLARIQSVSYLPEYADGKVKFEHLGNVSFATLSFRISPKDAVAELEKVWASALSCEAYYPKTRAVSLVKLAVTEFEGDTESGVITVKISGEGLSDEFFAGTQEAKVALVISDGNNQVVSDYANAYGHEITNEIWYTSTDGKIVEPTRPDAFDANIVSNTYEDGMGVIKFDNNITQIYLYAFCEQETQLGVANLQTIVLPKGVEKIGEFAFCHCSNLTSINIPSSIVSIEDAAFAIAPSSLTDVYISNLSDFCKIKFGSGTANPLYTDAYLNLNGNRLTEFIVPEDITTIKFGVFYHNSTITNVVMHDMVTAIGGRAFQGSSIECVTLGSGITNIYYDAFASCPNLQKVYCKAVTPPVAKKESDGWKAFNNNHRARMIYVPRQSVEAYKTADGWKDYADYIVGYDF